MSVAFVRQLRSNRPPLELAPSGPDTISFRVQAAESWDAVRVISRPDTPVREVKERALALFYPDAEYPDDFVLKLRGWEMLDESAPIAESGIVNGSIVLLGDRRRRPVR
jgi:hypothetical protein